MFIAQIRPQVKLHWLVLAAVAGVVLVPPLPQQLPRTQRKQFDKCNHHNCCALQHLLVKVAGPVTGSGTPRDIR